MAKFMIFHYEPKHEDNEFGSAKTIGRPRVYLGIRAVVDASSEYLLTHPEAKLTVALVGMGRVIYYYTSRGHACGT